MELKAAAINGQGSLRDPSAQSFDFLIAERSLVRNKLRQCVGILLGALVSKHDFLRIKPGAVLFKVYLLLGTSQVGCGALVCL